MILNAWQPHLAVVDMDHDDSSALLQRLRASSRLTKRVTPALGLTRRGDLKTKLRAFDLGVDDILTMPRHIRSLRIKLQNDYRHPRFIATVPGRGYRFIPTFTNQGWVGEGDSSHTPRMTGR